MIPMTAGRHWQHIQVSCHTPVMRRLPSHCAIDADFDFRRFLPTPHDFSCVPKIATVSSTGLPGKPLKECNFRGRSGAGTKPDHEGFMASFIKPNEDERRLDVPFQKIEWNQPFSLLSVARAS
jgi:hypothetical protein